LNDIKKQKYETYPTKEIPKTADCSIARHETSSSFLIVIDSQNGFDTVRKLRIHLCMYKKLTTIHIIRETAFQMEPLMRIIGRGNSFSGASKHARLCMNYVATDIFGG